MTPSLGDRGREPAGVPAAPPAPAVVMVPGLGLDDDAWEGVRAHLPMTSRVVGLPALGRPVPRGADTRVEAQVARLLQHPAVAGVGPVVLVGHSAGCSVAVGAAVRSADVVGLVLLGPVDPGQTSWPRMVRQWLRTATHEHPREVPRLLPQYARTGLRSIVGGMHRMRTYRTDAAAAGVDVPVVVVRGELDRISRAAWCEDLAAAPGRRLRTVVGAGHMVNLSHPAAVAAAVGDVMALVTGTPTTPDAARDATPDG